MAQRTWQSNESSDDKSYTSNKNKTSTHIKEHKTSNNNNNNNQKEKARNKQQSHRNKKDSSLNTVSDIILLSGQSVVPFQWWKHSAKMRWRCSIRMILSSVLNNPANIFVSLGRSKSAAWIQGCMQTAITDPPNCHHQQVFSRADGTQQKFLSEIPHPNLNQCDFIQIFACSTLLQFTTDYSMDSWIMVPESTGLDDWCLLCRVCTAKPTCHMATEWFSLADLGNVPSCYVQSTSSQIRLLRKGKHEMDWMP